MTEAFHDPLNEFGYSSEEWDYFPDETREEIIAANEATFAEIDHDDCIPSVQKPASTTRFQDLARKGDLNRSLENINKANKRIGLQAMTTAHPKYGEIDKAYGIPSAIKRGEAFDVAAREDLLRACGNCAATACGLRDNFKAFEKKYHTAPERAKFAKKLNQDPTAPC